jgi:hypothetical protein
LAHFIENPVVPADDFLAAPLLETGAAKLRINLSAERTAHLPVAQCIRVEKKLPVMVWGLLAVEVFDGRH